MERTDDAYYVGTHPYSFRMGEPAKILGVRTFYLSDNGRVCFHVIYEDGKEDWCPIEDKGNYKLLTRGEVRESLIDLSK